jgi:Protein of unknown function (DUF1353)
MTEAALDPAKVEPEGSRPPLAKPVALLPIMQGPDDPILYHPIGEEPLSVLYVDGRRWKLLERFDFASQALERIVRVPSGFETDFASIPRILWAILPPTGSYGKAAVLHDYLYRTHGACTRGQADRALLELMVALGVSWWTCLIIYLGVRIGGHFSYKGGL